MFLSLLLVPSLSVVVGLDFGHANIKAGMGKFSGVVAVNNQQSKKLSPSYFAFWNYSDPLNSQPPDGKHWAIEDIENCTWDYTSRAQGIAKRYPNNAIKSFFPLLNESIGLTHRESMAITLRHLLSTIDSGVYTPEKTMLALSVEPFLSKHERYALKEVARLANTTLTYIVDSPVAVANYYVLGRTKRLSNDIGFIDIGATGTWISIFSFSSMGKDVVMNQKSVVSNGTLGGHYIDQILGDFLYEKFVEQTGQKSESPKVKNMFYEAARIAKERLSIDVEYTINIEDVIEEYGLTYYITRQEFNQLIKPFCDALADLIRDAMEKAKVEKLDTVEAIGGNSRPQILHEIMANITKVDSISHTLNPEEAVILGTTILASTKSSSYRLPKKIKATTFCNSHIEIELNNNRTDLYKPKDKFEKFMPRYYKAGEVNNTNFTIYADDDYERPLDIFSVDIPENVSDDSEVMIKFGIDEHTLPYINKIEVDGKKVNVTHYYADWQLNNESFNASQSFIFRIEEVQEDRRNSSATRNELESFIWTVRDKMENDEEYKEFLSEEDVVNITRGLNEHKEWLDNITDPFVKAKEFQDKLASVKELTKDPDMRQKQYELIPESLEKLNKTLKEVGKYLEDEVPKKRPWLWTHYQSTMDNLLQNYNDSKVWLEENYYNLTHLNKTVNPETRNNQIDIKRQILEVNFNGSKKQKKPTPTPRPTPTPEGWTPPPPTPTPEEDPERPPRPGDPEFNFDPELHKDRVFQMGGPEDHGGGPPPHEDNIPLSPEEMEKKIERDAQQREREILRRHERRMKRNEEYEKQRQEALERGEEPPAKMPSDSETEGSNKTNPKPNEEKSEDQKKNEPNSDEQNTQDNKTEEPKVEDAKNEEL